MEFSKAVGATLAAGCLCLASTAVQAQASDYPAATVFQDDYCLIGFLTPDRQQITIVGNVFKGVETESGVYHRVCRGENTSDFQPASAYHYVGRCLINRDGAFRVGDNDVLVTPSGNVQVECLVKWDRPIEFIEAP